MEANCPNCPVEPQKILIADDDPTTRMMLRAAVTQWGYAVTEACDGEEAWTILKNPDAPRLLIIDWLMPKIEGVELCSRIRAELKSHHYIILLTQLTGAANLIRGLEAGADEFLSKPFNMAELCSRLSVGTRILNFENKMDAHNRDIEVHLSEIFKLSSSMRTNLNSINDVKNATADKKIDLVAKLDTLHKELDGVSNAITKLQQIIKM